MIYYLKQQNLKGPLQPEQSTQTITMQLEKPSEYLSLKAVLQGALLLLISNLVYIGNNYLVAWTHLTAPEIALVRGTFQMVLFAAIIYKRGAARKENITDQIPSPVLFYGQIVFFGFAVSTMSFACLAAIPLMPIGDLIVISFATPVFSVFLDRIVLKRVLTVLSITLCFLIVLGDVLVVQPPFLFKDKGSENQTSYEDEQPRQKHGQYYFLGVGLCLYAAAAGAVANVVGAKCNQMNISSSQLMLVSGISTLLLSLISASFLPNRLLTSPMSLSLKAAILLPVSAVITMVAYWTITLAISITHNPTLISMLRSTEILITLVTEAIWWNELPGTTSLLGSLLVVGCVLTMAAHDKILAAFRLKMKGSKEEEMMTVDNMM